MKILAGLSHKNLAQSLAKELNCQYIEAYTTTFDDSELRVQILEDINGCEVVIVQSTCRPVNNHLMELLLLVDTVKRAGAKSITAVIPYFGYSRQDRRPYIFAPVAARLVANMLEAAGVQRVITVDLHSQQLEGFFNIEVQNLNPISLFIPLINNYNNRALSELVYKEPTEATYKLSSQIELCKEANTIVNSGEFGARIDGATPIYNSQALSNDVTNFSSIAYIIVSPDIGGIARARAMSKLCNMEIAVINKSRTVNNEYHMSGILGNVEKKHCILIDDIVDSGQTICKGAKLLMECGALSVDAFITHPVLSRSSQAAIENSNITNIYITDTIAVANLSSKFQVVSIVSLLVTALKK
ncbi:ribose-phosphate diphosphokinase [Candidatus Tisiphia endosymbiont of Beris chalybata]|uniref:ribose-phosphate diphosphokinase n=1 Tax=Candidatus Tisiphia endosymbiont of Beris chalybata TaxID=3066262 RepID=UPI00312C88C9